MTRERFEIQPSSSLSPYPRAQHRTSDEFFFGMSDPAAIASPIRNYRLPIRYIKRVTRRPSAMLGSSQDGTFDYSEFAPLPTIFGKVSGKHLESFHTGLEKLARLWEHEDLGFSTILLNVKDVRIFLQNGQKYVLSSLSSADIKRHPFLSAESAAIVTS